MSSKVRYDPKLKDKFFESDDWICPDGGIRTAVCRDGRPVEILNDPCKPWPSPLWEKCFDLIEWTCSDGCKECATCWPDEPVSKVTARCYSASFNYTTHPIPFCEARLIDDDMIELLFHTFTPMFRESLLIRIRDGKFTCQFWIHDDVGVCTWTTTRQQLTVDKKAYQKGDVIKGRIDFECFQKVIDPKLIEGWKSDPSRTIKVFGVFKTVVE